MSTRARACVFSRWPQEFGHADQLRPPRPKATYSCWDWSALQIQAKASAPATIAAFRTAGITPILITGDHPGDGGGDCGTGRHRQRSPTRWSTDVPIGPAIRISCC